MALQVWLPLTVDARNQGLCGSLNNSNVTFADGGKLGGKYFSGGTITIPASISKTFFNKNHMSFAFWLYPMSSGTSIIMGQKAMAAGNNRMYSIFQYSTVNDLHLSWQDETSSSTFLGGTWSNFFPSNTWTHCCIVYNGSVATIYRNGEQYSTANGVSNRANFEYDYPIAGNAIRRLNDVRIYDHCLTPEEVKRISQGLILHYPLNRQGWGQENLAIGSNTNSLSSNAWYHSNAVGGTSREIVVDNDIPCVKITRDSTAQSSWHYFSYQNLDRAKLKTNTYYTVSFDIKPSAAGSISWAGFLNGNGTTPLCSTNTVIQGNMIANQWNHIILRTLTNSSLTLESQCVYMYLPASLRAANTWIMMKNMHIEEGTINTQWIPHTSDALYTTLGLNGTTEYDCSGFCNNGTRSGTFTWTSDAPKYCVSTSIEKGIINSTNSFVTTADPVFSVALWFKLKSGVSYTSYTDLISFSSSSYSNQPFRLEICGSPVGKEICWFRGPSGQSGGFGAGSNLSFDTWYHTVLVSEGNKQYTYYLNGEKKGTYNGSANTWTPTGNVSLGENINGVLYESDFRIYATALSADDVKSLYQNCATIGPDGTIYGKIR